MHFYHARQWNDVVNTNVCPVYNFITLCTQVKITMSIYFLSVVHLIFQNCISNLVRNIISRKRAYPIKMHSVCYALFCFGYTIVIKEFAWYVYPIFFRVASLAPGQSYDCPGAREVTLKDMDKIDLQQIKPKLISVHISCIFTVLYLPAEPKTCI